MASAIAVDEAEVVAVATEGAVVHEAEEVHQEVVVHQEEDVVVLAQR